MNGRESNATPPKAPRWVKAGGLIVVVLILLFLVLKLFGVGGEHGPGRHSGTGDTSPVSVTQVIDG